MQAKKTVAFFSLLLVLSTLTVTVRASFTPTIQFRSSDVTIVLTYPEEAHPDSVVSHNITITANTDLDAVSVTLYIYAPVNSTLQHKKNQTLSWGTLLENQSLPTNEIKFTPLQANGTLYCNMTVQTEIGSTIHHAYYSFYTTLVSDPTFSEMRVLYDEMLANYTSLQEDYEALFDDYNELLANYSSLFVNYTTLIDEYDQLVADYGTLLDDYDNLSANYSSLNATYTTLLSEHNQLTADYNSKVAEYNGLDDDYKSLTSDLESLQTDYDDLNSTHNSLQTDYETLDTYYGNLQDDYIMLNQTRNNLQEELADLRERLTDSEGVVNSDRIVMLIFLIALAVLIVFIVYIKRKQEDPYLVIRKETVSMKSDEET